MRIKSKYYQLVIKQANYTLEPQKNRS